MPPVPIRELRDLTRYRKALMGERQREANRLHKVLEDAGIKLASVASDILGQSGRAMLAALVEGTTDPAVLADLAKGKLRATLPALRTALAGRFRGHHAFLVRQILAHLGYLGVDMTVFPSDRHAASWVGLCPGNNASAGKHKAGTARKGNRWLRARLVAAALAAIRTKDGTFGARYRRILRHRGHPKAVLAVAHALLRTIYHVLTSGQEYRNLGPDYYDRRDQDRARRRAVQTLERLGFKVTIEVPAA